MPRRVATARVRLEAANPSVWAKSLGRKTTKKAYKDLTQVGIHCKTKYVLLWLVDRAVLREVSFKYVQCLPSGSWGAGAYPSMHWDKVKG